jgi:hypothetical protein
MSYNYNKHWLDQHLESIQQLKDTADSNSEIVWELDSFSELENMRRHIRSLLASLAVHYPNLAYVTENIRTWKTIDQTTGSILLHVGTADNFRTAPRQLKTRHGKRMVDAKLRGTKPQPVAMPSFVPTPEMLKSEPDIFTIPDQITVDNFSDYISGALEVAKLRNSQIIEFADTLLPIELVKEQLTNLDAWLLDDSTSSSDDRNMITFLRLRRRGELDNG